MHAINKINCSLSAIKSLKSIRFKHRIRTLEVLEQALKLSFKNTMRPSKTTITAERVVRETMPAKEATLTRTYHHITRSKTGGNSSRTSQNMPMKKMNKVVTQVLTITVTSTLVIRIVTMGIMIMKTAGNNNTIV